MRASNRVARANSRQRLLACQRPSLRYQLIRRLVTVDRRIGLAYCEHCSRIEQGMNMSVLIPIGNEEPIGIALEHAINLLSQQVWCWGRDILRPEGNFLLDIGFQRTEPPPQRKSESSVYTLKLGDHCVVLRAFGVFFGERRRGGVFLPRYEFRPRYCAQATLEAPPWSDGDLPQLDAPSDKERSNCAALTLQLLDWIRSYEVRIAEELGVEYRENTLLKWDDGERECIPAAQLPAAWRALSFSLAADLEKFLGR